MADKKPPDNGLPEPYKYIAKGKAIVESLHEKYESTPISSTPTSTIDKGRKVVEEILIGLNKNSSEEERLNRERSSYADEIIQHFENYLPLQNDEVKTFAKAKCEITKLAIEHEHYDNAYFNLYFLFMVFVYNCIWKISRSSKYKQRFTETAIFLRAYEGKSIKKKAVETHSNAKSGNNVIDFCNVESIFDYSRIPDKSIVKLFTLIDFDKDFIHSIDTAINLRNDMAHATNESIIVDRSVFGRYVNDLKNFMKRINDAMKPLIQQWYLTEFLLKTLRGEYSETISSDFKVVWEDMVANFSLSQSEIIACGEFGLKKYISEQHEFLSVEKIKQLKAMNKYVKEKNFS